MSNETIKNLVEELKQEIQQSHSAEPELKNKITKLIATIEDSSEEADEGLIESVEEQVSEFEASHPKLTIILNRIMVALSNIGI